MINKEYLYDEDLKQSVVLFQNDLGVKLEQGFDVNVDVYFKVSHPENLDGSRYNKLSSAIRNYNLATKNIKDKNIKQAETIYNAAFEPNTGNKDLNDNLKRAVFFLQSISRIINNNEVDYTCKIDHTQLNELHNVINVLDAFRNVVFMTESDIDKWKKDNVSFGRFPRVKDFAIACGVFVKDNKKPIKCKWTTTATNTVMTTIKAITYDELKTFASEPEKWTMVEGTEEEV